MQSKHKAEVVLRREHFNRHDAPPLAAQIGVPEACEPESASSRFAYFADAFRFVVVAGIQEEADVGKALAFGMTYRSDRRLVLALPMGYSFASTQRAPWFSDRDRPEIWEYENGTAAPVPPISKGETVELLGEARHGNTPEAALKKDATGLHLGDRSRSVTSLVNWATEHPMLDPGHRQGERSWHCMGQKVLSIEGTRRVRVTAGIHNSKATVRTFDIDTDPTDDVIEVLRAAVEDGIGSRRVGKYYDLDEHWLQAAIRRNPRLVYVEQPALRELPAWRPRSAPSKRKSHPTRWGRGYIDLVGMDGQGDIRIVETKVADNKDEMLVLQGVDYYVWSKAHQAVLRSRLGASDKAVLEINYVVGANGPQQPTMSPFTAALARSLDSEIRWRFQFVYDWQRADSHPDEVRSTQLPPMTLPK